MNLRNYVYKYQFFTFALIMMIFAVQYILLMADRGVEQAQALIVLSVSQFLMMLAMLLITRIKGKIKYKNRIIQASFILRTVSVLLMFFTTNSTLFIALFLIFQISTAASYLFEGMIAQWSFNTKGSFGSFRAFFSFGIAVATFVAAFIVNITGDFNYLLLFALVLLIFNTIGALKYPVEISDNEDENEQKKGLPLKFRFLLILGALAMAMSNAYVAHLNTHYMDVFGIPLATTLTLAAIAMFIAAFVSEGSAFLTANKFVEKLTAKWVIFLGLALGMIRWFTVLISPNEIFFTATYLFHGFVFVFIYVGSLSYIKEKAGNEFTDKMVMEFTVFQLLIGITMTQLINVVLSTFSYVYEGAIRFESIGYLTVIGIYIAVSFLILLIYYFGYIFPEKRASNKRNS